MNTPPTAVLTMVPLTMVPRTMVPRTTTVLRMAGAPTVDSLLVLAVALRSAAFMLLVVMALDVGGTVGTETTPGVDQGV